MKDYERTCWTARPDSNRGLRNAPSNLFVIQVEQSGPDEYEVWLDSGDSQWWYEFNDWLLSHITQDTWIGHHAHGGAVINLCGKDAMWFKLHQRGWPDE